MSKVGNFITYNNLVPITISVVLLGGASAFAATNPELIYEERQEVVTIDNTYIASLDLERYSPEVEIQAVREDDEFYYIEYILSTVDLIDHVWQDVERPGQLRVRKSRLTPQMDLGLFVTEQLRQKVAQEQRRLQETQRFEQEQVTQKQVATSYSGLVGGRLSSRTETIPGYEPRVQPRRTSSERALTFARPDLSRPPVRTTPPEREIAVETRQEDREDSQRDELDIDGEITDFNDEVATDTDTDTDRDDSSPTGGGASETETSEDTTDETPEVEVDTETDAGTADDSGTSTPPRLSLLGDEMIELLVGDTYSDKGVVIHDPHDIEPELFRYVDGESVSTIALDTTQARTYVIEYVLSKGSTIYTELQRTVVIVLEDEPDDSDVPPAPEDSTATSSDDDTATTDSPTVIDSASTATGSDDTTETPAQNVPSGDTDNTGTSSSDTPSGDQSPMSTDSTQSDNDQDTSTEEAD